MQWLVMILVSINNSENLFNITITKCITINIIVLPFNKQIEY
jgi:hypothetical protein